MSRKNIQCIILACLLLLIISSALVLLDAILVPDDTEKIYDELRQENISIPTSTEPVTQEETVSPEELEKMKLQQELNALLPEKSVDFKELWDVNKDVYAYIYVPETSVDYPVLQHESDDLYYLEYNIDGSKGYPGCIYTELCNSKDFNDRVTLMYGHNMKNGTMFATLHNYESKDFFDANPYFFIYTPEGTIVYEVFAAVTYSNEHIMKTYDFAKDEQWEKFFDKLYTYKDSNAHYREDVTIEKENQVLILSTCTTSDKYRFLVCGVKKGMVMNGEN